ncbi:MAG: hypothetical protein K1X89_09350 [Myxococcaceae bacterium]|nr:hypothetical protein [Myxococcaceae bacterium]
MTRYFGVIIAIGFVIGGIAFAYNKYDAKSVESARELSAARIKAEYLERVPWIRNIPDEKAYKSEVTDFLRWYFKDVNEHLNKYGGSKKFDEYLDELAEREKKGKGGDRADEKKAAYEYVRKTFDAFQGGNYEPMWTATDKGIRWDLVSTNPVMSGGEQKIRYQIVVWGLPRQERTDERGVKRVTATAAFHINWKLLDEKGKLLGEMNADGDPSSRIDWPERYVKWFPPGVLLGHYDVDLIPAEVPQEKGKPAAVKTADITFSIQSRSPTGGDINTSYNWKLDVPAEWKLRAGAEWKGATDSVRSEEEIDPSKQAKK